MMKEMFSRLVCSILCVLWLLTSTVDFVLGKSDTFSTVLLFVCYFLFIVYLSLSIFNIIFKKVIEYQAYKQCKDTFNYLQVLYKKLHNSYFTGTIRDVEMRSEALERFGNLMLDIGEGYIANKTLSHKQTKEVQEMLSKTKEMMATAN